MLCLVIILVVALLAMLIVEMCSLSAADRTARASGLPWCAMASLPRVLAVLPYGLVSSNVFTV